MAITNHKRVGRARDFLSKGLRPFVERELKACHGGTEGAGHQGRGPLPGQQGQPIGFTGSAGRYVGPVECGFKGDAGQGGTQPGQRASGHAYKIPGCPGLARRLRKYNGEGTFKLSHDNVDWLVAILDAVPHNPKGCHSTRPADSSEYNRAA